MRGENYIELQETPSITIRTFAPLIKTAERVKSSCSYVERLGFPTLSVKAGVTIGEDSSLKLLLCWQGGEQAIEIIRERSNLIEGAAVYYFLCPFGYKSRKLYFVGGKWRSRRSFKGYYAQQLKSRKWRELAYLSVTPPTAYGRPKEHYRGKLTPYGKRLRRYRQRQDKGEEALTKYILNMTITANNILK